MVGRTISHYKILAKLGEGGMGLVYKAEDIKLKRTVALKFLKSDALEDEKYKVRFLREAQAAASLVHPNICVIYEIDEADGSLFIAMEFVEGQSVKEMLEARPLKLEEALDSAIQTAYGLHAAHENGVVHRDIKSANLIVTPQGLVKIMDFGIARLAGRTPLTKEETVLGTLAYMSPEQLQGKKCDRRTDIWSLGVMLCEMISGRLPFGEAVQAAVTYSILNEQPEPLTALRSGVPIELDRIVRKALAKDVEQRYQHADEFAADLRALQASTHPAESTLRARRRWTGALETPDRKRRNRRIGAGIAAALLVTAAAWWIADDSGPVGSSVDHSRLTRLTSDSGLTFQPSISRDGRIVAFASDRAGPGNLDIWVKQIGGGDPIRLSQHLADEHEPALSPSGTMVAYRSEREPPGIYVQPTLGGEERLVALDGHMPRFSPDEK